MTTPLTLLFRRGSHCRTVQKRTGGGRKSVSGERYDPTEDFDEEPSKIVPKSDELNDVSMKFSANKGI